LEECTLADLAAAAAIAAPSIRLQDKRFAEVAACAAGHRHAVCRFVANGSSAGSCPECDAALVVDDFHTHRLAPWSLLGPIALRPLGEIGGERAGWVLVCGEDRAVLFR
jgi:hypothetical protein